MKALLCIAIATTVLLTGQAKASGVCESARIPLWTVDLGGGSSICVAPFCGQTEPKHDINGSITCTPCDQSPWGTEYAAKSDLCPTALGTCQDGFCCPKKGKDTWYNQNFGRDWAGMNTFPYITVTTYGGSTACGGTVDQATKWVNRMGIDGVAAVPSQMYGSWGKNSFAQSQHCYVNNNLCYKVTDMRDRVHTLAVWGKCGGYIQCQDKAGQEDVLPESMASQATRLGTAPDVAWGDANQCINQAGATIGTGTTPDCLVVNGGDGKDPEGKNCCPHKCQKWVDWCGSNDHPQFDVTDTVYLKMCPENAPCLVKKVEPFLCPWSPPNNPFNLDWTAKFGDTKGELTVKQPGDPEVRPIHDPYPKPDCLNMGPTLSDPDWLPAYEAEDPVEDVKTPTCDAVTSNKFPLEPVGYNGTEICKIYCEALLPNCLNDPKPMKCVKDGIKAQLCPDDSCGCVFEAAT